MPSQELGQHYLEWLYSLVADPNPRPRARTFRALFRKLSDTIFVAWIPHDENRVEDAKDLRYEFLAENEDATGDPEWTGSSVCNMLELLVILSRQIAFELDDPADIWFWHLIETLDLEQFDDNNFDDHAEEVIEEALDRVIWRRFKPSGEGGLFPLHSPDRDQRQVELWYQLNAYLLEQF